MADLTKILTSDPTLDAADRVMEEAAAKQLPRAYLGMSQIGESCSRKLWYSFRFAVRERFKADTLKRFEDGHASEAVQIKRLQAVPGVILEDVCPVTGDQFRYTDHDGHYSGHCDGKITGLLQAPKKKHIYEHKAVSDKKFNELKKIIAEVGEKQALRKWNPTYYGQAQQYMMYEGTDRHYMTVSTPGVRATQSLRTEYDAAFALSLKVKASRIIRSEEPLDRISDKPDWFECKLCPAKGICHDGDMPDRTCRTCLHVTPIANGQWHCERFGKTLSLEEQVNGCAVHKFLPSLVPGDIVDHGDSFVKYRMPDGSEWVDGEG